MNTAADWWDIQEVLVRLPDRERQVCVMVMDGYTQREIADHIGVSPSTISRIFFRLRPIFRA